MSVYVIPTWGQCEIHRSCSNTSTYPRDDFFTSCYTLPTLSYLTHILGAAEDPRFAPPPGCRRLSAAMARRRATAVAPAPPQVPVVDAATVASEARRSAADVRKMKNATDLAATQVHLQHLREENRQPNTRSTYSKCWRLWRVSAGASRQTPARARDPLPLWQRR